MQRKQATRKLAMMLAFVLACTAVFATPDVADAAKKAPKTKKITLSAKKKTLYVGKSFTLKVKKVTPKKASKKVTYKTSNKKVATVSKKGKVTGKKVGKATITVTSKSNKKVKAKCKITVKQQIKKITVTNPKSKKLTLQKGKTFTLKTTISPKKPSSKKLTYKSNKTKVAKVSSKGKITAVAAGTAKITIAAADKQGAKATVTVTVTNPTPAKPAVVQATGVTLNKTALSLEKGKTEQLTATVAPANTTNKAVTWASDKAAVATVSNTGLVTAVAAGEANITVKTSNGKTATCKVTVTDPTTPPAETVAVTGVKLDKDTLELEEGATATLKATIEPANATNQNVTWESSNAAIAKVENGTVTAVAAGEANITVKTEDGGKTATCKVTVKAKAPVDQKVAVTGVKLDKDTLELEEGANADLTATVEPSNATDKTVTWASSEKTVADVDASGKVTAVAAGTADITVTTKDGNFTATCKVTVTAKAPESNPVKSITLNDENVEVGKKVTITPTIDPADGTYYGFRYMIVTSKEDLTPVDSDVVSIEWDGQNAGFSAEVVPVTVTGLKAGKAYVMAELNTDNQEGPSENPVVAVSEITVSNNTEVSVAAADTTITVGDTTTVTATVTPDDAYTFEWKSDNDEIATVEGDGADDNGYTLKTATVKGVAAGTAKITVTVKLNGIEVGTADVEIQVEEEQKDVTPEVGEEVTITPDKLNLTVGDKTTLTAKVDVTGDNAADVEYDWVVGGKDTTSIKVTGNGKTAEVEALAEGTATVTVNVVYNSKILVSSDPINVTVAPKEEQKDVTPEVGEEVTITPDKLNLTVGDKTTLTAKVDVTGDNAADVEYDWVVGGKDTTSIKVTGNGKTAEVEALAEGTATVTVNVVYNSKILVSSDPINVTVAPKDVTPDVALPSKLSVEQGKTASLTATATGDNATFSWDCSSDTGVISIATTDDAKEVKVIGKKVGIATVTVTMTVNGKTYTSECTVTVTPSITKDITVTIKGDATVEKGKTTKLTAELTGKDATGDDATGATYSWTIASPDVATATDGNVTGKTITIEGSTAGKTTVTVTVTIGETEYKADITITVIPSSQQEEPPKKDGSPDAAANLKGDLRINTDDSGTDVGIIATKGDGTKAETYEIVSIDVNSSPDSAVTATKTDGSQIHVTGHQKGEATVTVKVKIENDFAFFEFRVIVQ